MNNQKIILAIGFVLLGIIGYQGYLLSQKDTQTTPDIIEKKIIKKDAPEIHINIDNAPTKTSKSLSQDPSVSPLSEDARHKQDQANIEKSIQDVFRNIFASKEVQDGISQFRQQAQVGMQELQKELEHLPEKIEKMQDELKDDPFFSQVLGQLKGFGGKQLEDKGDFYYMKMTVPGGKESKIDIQTKGHFLTIMIDAKNTQKTQTANGTMMQSSSQSSSSSIMIPSDALVEKLQTDYKDGILELTIPKITTKTSL